MYVKLQNDIGVIKYECFYLQMIIFLYRLCMFIFAFSNYALHLQTIVDKCAIFEAFLADFKDFLAVFKHFLTFFSKIP